MRSTFSAGLSFTFSAGLSLHLGGIVEITNTQNKHSAASVSELAQPAALLGFVCLRKLRRHWA
jgi:predicted phage tail protein